MNLRTTLTSCMLLAFASSASSAAIIAVSSVSTTAAASNGTNIDSIINGSGLAEALTDANKLTVIHTGGLNLSNQFLCDNVNNTTFTFNFTGGATIGEILVWNYSQNDIRGLDAISNVEVDTGSGFNSILTNINLLTASAAGDRAQSINLGSNFAGVTAIRLTVAQGDTGGGETAGGFNEVAFANSVPEPSVALLGGLGVLVALRRRRM